MAQQSSQQSEQDDGAAQQKPQGPVMPDTAETRRYSEKAGFGGMDGLERDKVATTPGSGEPSPI